MVMTFQILCILLTIFCMAGAVAEDNHTPRIIVFGAFSAICMILLYGTLVTL